MSQLNQVLYEMLTENTGRALCDSGDAYGRNWQRNQLKTLEDFENEPEATLDVYKGSRGYDLSPTISLFHHLRQSLDLDEFCRKFNALEVGNWNGEFYGTDQNQCDWLTEYGFTSKGNGFNSYNWTASFSQVVQGEYLDRDGERYVLLQIHGGCDVRGGYTNARLFKVECEGFLFEDCNFSVETEDGEVLTLSWYGEWIDGEGQCASDEYLAKFCETIGEGIHAGDHYVFN